MKVKFKGPVKIDGIHYAPGNRELPDHQENHWYLKALIKDKHAEILEGPKSFAAVLPPAKPLAFESDLSKPAPFDGEDDDGFLSEDDESESEDQESDLSEEDAKKNAKNAVRRARHAAKKAKK